MRLLKSREERSKRRKFRKIERVMIHSTADERVTKEDIREAEKLVKAKDFD